MVPYLSCGPPESFYDPEVDLDINSDFSTSQRKLELALPSPRSSFSLDFVDSGLGGGFRASLALTAGNETMWSYGSPGHVPIALVLVLVYDTLLYPWIMAFSIPYFVSCTRNPGAK